MDEAPELLFLTDHRGYTALQYIPHPANLKGATGSHQEQSNNNSKNQTTGTGTGTGTGTAGSCCRTDWCHWIRHHQDWLRQKVVNSKWLQACDQLDDAQSRIQKLIDKAAQYNQSSSSSSSDDERAS